MMNHLTSLMFKCVLDCVSLQLFILSHSQLVLEWVLLLPTLAHLSLAILLLLGILLLLLDTRHPKLDILLLLGTHYPLLGVTHTLLEDKYASVV